MSDYYGNDPVGDLEYVDSFEKSGESYQFDITQVMFSPERGAYFVGRDSGCSCPCPFEDFRTEADWGKPLTAQEARQEVLKDHTAMYYFEGKRLCAEAITAHAKDRGLW